MPETIEIPCPFEAVGRPYVELLRLLGGMEGRVRLYRASSSSLPQSGEFASSMARLLNQGPEITVVGETLTTQVPEGAFECYGFPCKPASIDVLLEFPHSIYAWQNPPLLDDLCVVRPDGSVIMGSIGHEHDWWLSLRESELGLFEPLLRAQRVPTPEIVADAPNETGHKVAWYGHAAAYTALCKRILAAGDPGTDGDAMATVLRGNPGQPTPDGLAVPDGIDLQDLASAVLSAIDELYWRRTSGVARIFPEDFLGLVRPGAIEVVIDFADEWRDGGVVRSCWNELRGRLPE